MLAPTSERIDDALGRLSPDDRALLELSLRRGVSDADIAALLHVPREHVEHLREQALERLADDLSAGSRAEAAALVGQSMRTNGEAAIARRVTDLPPLEQGAVRSRRRTRARLLVAALLVAGVAAVAIVLSSGGEEPVLGPDPDAPAPKPAPAPAPAPRAGPSVALAPVTAGAARGTAQLRGSSLRFQASGLPAGPYAVWLFDDVSDAKMVARFQGPAAKLDAKLPKGFERYRFIDVSLEPADGNPNHSGASVLRAPVTKLLGR